MVGVSYNQSCTWPPVQGEGITPREPQVTFWGVGVSHEPLLWVLLPSWDWLR